MLTLGQLPSVKPQIDGEMPGDIFSIYVEWKMFIFVVK